MLASQLTSRLAPLACAVAVLLLIAAPLPAQTESAPAISYATQIRPLLAARCFGCHQGAIDEGDYNMTAFAALVAGGASGSPAIVPGKPEESYLLELIEPHDGRAEMPPEGNPLSEAEVALVRQWIAEGAVNDAPADRVLYSPDNLPKYTRLPLIGTLDISPDGKHLAVSGFHEVIVLEMPESGTLDPGSLQVLPPVARLVGLSPRIASVRFSPDGTRLAVAGGKPGVFGEVQIWNWRDAELALSRTVSYDTLAGVNWSPDGTLVSFGCTDTTVRVIRAEDGTQVLFQGAHDDWIHDTVFSVDGSQLVSVGRDMSCKLIDVATERFIDNITSITPGVLKGGIASVARHRQRDEVVIGGADGQAKIYRMNRLTKRVIGDDANLIRRYPKMEGRINAVSISPDGSRLAAASSLNGRGYLEVYDYPSDTEMPGDIRGIVAKTVQQQNADEKARLEAYVTTGTAPLFQLEGSFGALHALDFSADGKRVVAAGSDGHLLFVNVTTGQLEGTVAPVELDRTHTVQAEPLWRFRQGANATATSPNVPLAAGKLQVDPPQIDFQLPTDYTQLVVRAQLEDDSWIDVTSAVEISVAAETPVECLDSLVQPTGTGQGHLDLSWNGLSLRVPVRVQFPEEGFSPDFIRDINPVLTQLGCNAGTCHGSQGGKKGFKLSLRGYDPLYDIRALTDEMASRRVDVNLASESLMLKKPTAQVAHEGGQLIEPGGKYYWLIEQWIASGARLNLEVPRVQSLSVYPLNPVLRDADFVQQMRVVATYEDGSQRDVTREAVLEAGDIEIIQVQGSQVTALRRGESPVLARYEGAFTSTTVTVMGNREGFAWEPPPTWGPIDEFVAQKWQRLKIQPAPLCDDAEFIRRLYLDLTGLPPTPEAVATFLSDPRPTRAKREALVDQLVGNDEYVEHWTNKWADLMQVNRKYLGTEGATALRAWIAEQVRTNRPYDEFAREILTASGSNRENPAAAYYKIHRTAEDAMENTTHLFLATRFNCNKCHDHPFERWTQDQYYETAAFFAQIQRQPDPAAGDKKIGGSAVEDAKPLYEIVSDVEEGELLHARTGKVAQPEFPFEAPHDVAENAPRREQLASWITSPENPYFATSHVNRLWGYLLGVGLIEPLDDIRAGNPATNPELLEYLRQELIRSGFDSRHIIKLICKSRTYQLSVAANAFNADDQTNYSHALARRLPAEVLFDAIHRVTGSELKIPGVQPGTRAAALPDSGAKLPSGFLSTLGRPPRESVCECERTNDLQLGSVLALVSGPDLARAIGDSGNALVALVAEETDDRQLVERLFLRVLNRPARPEEIDVALEAFKQIQDDHQRLVAQRDERQAWFDQQLPTLEQARLEAVSAAEAELNAAIAAQDPELLQKEAAQQQAVAAAQAKLDQHRAQAPTLEQWRQRQLQDIAWRPLTAPQYESKIGRPSTLREDHSILLDGSKPGADVGTLLAQTSGPLSAVRLELLTDPSLPQQGPGLAENGNFVLTEFEMEIASPDAPEVWKPVKFSSVIADFNQQNFPPELTIDGQQQGKQGWASAPRNGELRWATFQLDPPLEAAEGTRVRFRLHQNFDDRHQLGCFRISLSGAAEAVGLSLPQPLLETLAQGPEAWDEATAKRFADLAKADDPAGKQLEAELAQASQPVMVHLEIAQARAKLERVSRPVPVDPLLAQLRQDVEQSQHQLSNARLTATQDLTWALINSPAFLFNH